MDNSQ